MKMLWLLKRAILWREKARSRPRIYLLMRVYLLLVSPVASQEVCISTMKEIEATKNRAYWKTNELNGEEKAT